MAYQLSFKKIHTHKKLSIMDCFFFRIFETKNLFSYYESLLLFILPNTLQISGPQT